MDIVAHQPLAACNTLNLPAYAEYFCRVASAEDIHQALHFSRERHLAITVLGGGSNVVIADDIPGLVVQVDLRGVSFEPQSGDLVQLTAAAGENWHDLVAETLGRGCYGLENLSLIPGLVGAAPIQNIGAYGVELSDCFVGLQAVSLDTGESAAFDSRDCHFGYRDSVFKHEHRGAWLITSVTLELHRQRRVNIEYPALRQALVAGDAREITPELVAQTVCQIRRQRLPDPILEPNAGSFFKNPVISAEQADRLRAAHADAVLYPQEDGRIKVPAAWLIERAGWKGRVGRGCRVHPDHALVITNIDAASGQDVLALAAGIAADVNAQFAIELEMEPCVLGG